MPAQPVKGWGMPVLTQVSVVLRIVLLFVLGPYLAKVGGMHPGILIALVGLALELIVSHAQNDAQILKGLAKEFEPEHFKEVPPLGIHNQAQWADATGGYRFHFLLASTSWTYIGLYGLYLGLALVAQQAGWAKAQIHWLVTPLGVGLVLMAFTQLRQLRAEAAYYAAWAQNPQDPDQSPQEPAPKIPELRLTTKLAALYALAASALAAVATLDQGRWVDFLGLGFLVLLLKVSIPAVNGCRNDQSLMRRTLFKRHPVQKEGFQ